MIFKETTFGQIPAPRLSVVLVRWFSGVPWWNIELVWWISGVPWWSVELVWWVSRVPWWSVELVRWVSSLAGAGGGSVGWVTLDYPHSVSANIWYGTVWSAIIVWLMRIVTAPTSTMAGPQHSRPSTPILVFSWLPFAFPLVYFLSIICSPHFWSSSVFFVRLSIWLLLS